METPEQNMNIPDIISQFELFIDSNQDKLVHHAFFRLGDRKDAEDAVQDVMIKIFGELKQGKILMNPTAYAYRLLANACTDRQRRANRYPRVSFQDIPDSGVETCENREDELIREEEFRRINKLLGSIPGEQAEIVRLRFVDGLPFQQIAEILEQPLTTVKSRFSYGLLKIKTLFFNQKEVSHAV